MTVTVTCLECGEIFEAQRRSRKFCCDAHKLKYNRRRKRQAPAERKRERDRGYARTRRAAERQQLGPDQPVLHLEAGAPVDRLAAWAQNVLRVPPGHPAVGEPMVLPDYGRRFLADAMQDQIREALLTMSRKNGKSARKPPWNSTATLRLDWHRSGPRGDRSRALPAMDGRFRAPLTTEQGERLQHFFRKLQ